MIRRWRKLIAVVPGLLLLVFLRWSLPVAFDAPWWLEPDRVLSLEAFVSESSTLRLGAEGLAAVGTNDQGQRLLVAPIAAFPAASIRFLHIRFGALPVELMPVLLWRRRGGELTVAAIPWHASGAIIDTSRFADWQGEIERVGVAFMPVGLALPGVQSSTDPVLAGFSLHGASVLDAWRVQVFEWRAYRSWTGRSINTAGFELPWRSAIPLPIALLALWATIAITVGLWSGRAALPLITALAVGAWITNDLFDVSQHRLRAAEARALAKDAANRSQVITVFPPLAAELPKLRVALGQLPPETKVMIAAEQRFFSEYPQFLLRDFDVGVLGDAEPPGLQRSTGLLVLNDARWQYDAERRELRRGSQIWSAELRFESALVRLFLLAATEPGR